MLDVALPGTGGMMPLPGRWLSCLLVRLGGELLLFDCGEGTQVALAALGWGFRRLGTIVISHCHADHVSGLPGLLLRLANSDRVEPVRLFGPPGLCAVAEGLRGIAPVLPFEVRCEELAPRQPQAVAGGRLVAELADHGLPCLSYRFDVPRQPAFQPERARALGLPVEHWQTLQRGEAISWRGHAVEPSEVLGPPRRGLAVAYLTDTRPAARLVELAAGVDLLVCEGTYGDDADAAKAVEHGHMTFREAAELAAAAGARRLWLTHFSPALQEPERYLSLARQVFPAAEVGNDGRTVALSFEDR
ncbi:MAG: ribonuclease Z [Chloroflexi bacterium]|nr:ribonuclease Z [Chloroflexota bacterium]